MPLEPWQAIAISVASLAAGWLIYDGLCRSPLGAYTVPLFITVFALILAAAVLYTKVFSGRGAFLHVGALTGTIMAVNVFFVIVPNQKKMVAQLIRGEEPDARYGAIGKQRSVHNNYMTLPVLVMMLSGHYPFLFGHPQSWLVVALIFIVGALVRHYINRIDAGDDWGSYGWAGAVGAFALCAAIYVTAPRTTAGGPAVADADAQALVQKHCVMCHARKPTHPSFQEAPKNVMLETIPDMRRWAPSAASQVENKAMPLGNQTAMTDEERATFINWARAVK
jgi:uncharacterized membrane protein